MGLREKKLSLYFPSAAMFRHFLKSRASACITSPPKSKHRKVMSAPHPASLVSTLAYASELSSYGMEHSFG